jgi:hypothetical protein
VSFELCVCVCACVCACVCHSFVYVRVPACACARVTLSKPLGRIYTTHTHSRPRSDGGMPFADVKNTEMRRKIKRGLRLAQPEVCVCVSVCLCVCVSVCLCVCQC